MSWSVLLQRPLHAQLIESKLLLLPSVLCAVLTGYALRSSQLQADVVSRSVLLILNRQGQAEVLTHSYSQTHLLGEHVKFGKEDTGGCNGDAANKVEYVVSLHR